MKLFAFLDLDGTEILNIGDTDASKEELARGVKNLGIGKPFLLFEAHDVPLDVLVNPAWNAEAAPKVSNDEMVNLDTIQQMLDNPPTHLIFEA